MEVDADGLQERLYLLGREPLARKVACPTAAEPRVATVFRSFISIEPDETVVML